MMENLNLPLDFLAEETMVLGEKLTREKEEKNLLKTSLEKSNDEPVQLELSPEDRLKHIKDRMKEYLQKEDYISFDEETPSSQNNDEFIEEDDYQHDKVVDGPGIIFRIAESAGTYIVRSVCVESLQKQMEQLFDDFEDPDFKKLRLDEKDQLDELRTFTCETFEQAEVLHELFSNRRLPKEEDVLCNISDPGFSWWLDTEPGKCTIYFKSHGVECAKNYLKLGPLSDINVFRRRMNQLNELLQERACGMNIFEDDNSLTISANGSQSLLFDSLKKLILKGEVKEDSELMGILFEHITLRYYLSEIAVVRTFWLEVERILSANQTIQ